MLFKKFNLLLFLIFFLFFQSYIKSEVETSIETKISIETSLEERLRKVLTEITGTEKIIVIVNVELLSEKEKQPIPVKPPEERKKVVLPGVPVKESIADRKIEDLIAPLDIGKTKTMIKRINATIIIDSAVSPAVLEIAKKVAVGLLGIDTERGDNLVFEKMAFQKNPFSWNSLKYPPYLFYLIAIGLGFIFVLGSMLFIFTPFRNFARGVFNAASAYVNSLKEGKTSEISGGASDISFMQSVLQTGPAQARQYQAGEKEEMPFSFVNTENEEKLFTVIKTEPPENIAVVLNYIDRDIATRIFSKLPKEKQISVAEVLSQQRRVSEDSIKAFEQKIKNTLTYSIGGEGILLNLLDYASKDIQMEMLLEMSQKNPEYASYLRKRLFSFEDISEFEPQVIMAIARRVNIPLFAQLLKGLQENNRQKIISVLPEVMQRRIRQEMELSRPLAQSVLEEEKRRIIKMIRQMVQDGLIQIKK